FDQAESALPCTERLPVNAAVATAGASESPARTVLALRTISHNDAVATAGVSEQPAAVPAAVPASSPARTAPHLEPSITHIRYSKSLPNPSNPVRPAHPFTRSRSSGHT